MDADETVDCPAHGRQAVSFVCTHIAHGLPEGSTPGFVVAPEDDHPLPLGWCDECEVMVQELGGDWIDEATERAEFKLLCVHVMSKPRESRFRRGGSGT